MGWFKTREIYSPLVIQYVYEQDDERGEDKSDGKGSCSKNESRGSGGVGESMILRWWMSRRSLKIWCGNFEVCVCLCGRVCVCTCVFVRWEEKSDI